MVLFIYDSQVKTREMANHLFEEGRESIFNVEIWPQYVFTETKKFSNILQIRIFITEIHVEITQTE